MINSPLVRKLIQLAIEEDLSAGDITSELTVPSEHRSRASILAREQLVFCGEGIPEAVYRELGFGVSVDLRVRDGVLAAPDQVLFKIEGRTRELLSSERTVLNFLQRLSGVATYTRQFIERSAGMTVLDTRKTTPGWRLLEKYAVRVGGARNHRLGLGDMILVKNNHIDANRGDIKETLNGIMAAKPRYMPVEVEVRSIPELEQAVEHGAEIIMLDNMNNEEVSVALARLRGLASGMPVEVSGGLSADRIAALAGLGVDCVSVGALTTQSTCVDISMRLERFS